MRISAGHWPGSPSWSGAGSGLRYTRFRLKYTLAVLDLPLHRIGWSVQVPARRAAERDEARIAAWICFED